MKHNSLRTWTFVATVGLLVTACSDRPDQIAPAVPEAPQFALGTSVLSGTTVINGARWTAAFPIGVGTGLIDPFLSIQNSPSEEGFNTDASPLPLNATRPQFTDPLPLNNVPIISEAGGTWREFILDANESNSNPDAQFSIDFFNVYVCQDANAPNYSTVAAFASNANCTQVYNINGHAALRATDAATSGSGSDLDYRILIPSASFGTAANAACQYNPNGADCGYYIIVHTKMGGEGGDWVTGATFEELSTIRRPALAIVKTPNSQTVNAGSSITFTMVVSNTGEGTATAVTLSDPLPAGAGVDWTTSTAGCSITGTPPNETLNCTIGDLVQAASFTATVTSTTTGASCGVYNNTATFNSTNAGTGEDAGQITVANCNGQVTIVKNTTGGDAAFPFTAGGTPLTNFTLTTVAGTASQGPTTVPVGTYTVSENALGADWEFVSVVCTGNGSGGTTSSTSSQTATIVVGLGANVTCTFTNRKKASLTIKKVVTAGSNQATLFTFDPSSNWNGDANFQLAHNGTKSSGLVTPGTYSVAETVPSGWEQVGTAACVKTAGPGTLVASASGNSASVTLAAGQAVECTFTNRELATLIVTKTANTSALFNFSRFGCASGTPTLASHCALPLPGSLLENFSMGNLGSQSTSKVLPPGTYLVCELGVAVSSYSVSATLTDGNNANPANAAFLSGETGNGNFCVVVTLASGNTRTVAFDNFQAPGSTRTIGYWKNWSSCDGHGNQWEKALAAGEWNKTLDGNLPQTLGDTLPAPVTGVTFAGSSEPNAAPGCAGAINILNKSAVNGDKRPGDPIYSMAAQLLAALLNMNAGSGSCTAANNAVTAAQRLLTQLGFNGTGSYSVKDGTLTKAQQNTANTQAGILDSFNNGTLGGTCPTHAN